MVFLGFRGPRDSEARRRLQQAIQTHSGVTKAELCRLTGLSWGTVFHHIRSLVRLDQVRVVRTNRRVYIYGRDIHSDQFAALRLLRDETIGKILDQVRSRPGVGINALSRSLNVSRKTIRRHLGDLVDAHIVEKSPDYRPRFQMTPSFAEPPVERPLPSFTEDYCLAVEPARTGPGIGPKGH